MGWWYDDEYAIGWQFVVKLGCGIVEEGLVGVCVAHVPECSGSENGNG